jgi:hypothetical protein
MRFENELEEVEKLGGLLVQVQREGVTSVNNHISDKVLDENRFHAIIENNGTLGDLEDKVGRLLNDLNPFKNTAGISSFSKFIENKIPQKPLTKYGY